MASSKLPHSIAATKSKSALANSKSFIVGLRFWGVPCGGQRGAVGVSRGEIFRRDGRIGNGVDAFGIVGPAIKSPRHARGNAAPPRRIDAILQPARVHAGLIDGAHVKRPRARTAGEARRAMR